MGDGRNLPVKEFCYLRTNLLTAAVRRSGKRLGFLMLAKVVDRLTFSQDRKTETNRENLFPRLVVFCLLLSCPLSPLHQLKDMKRLMVYERKRKG